MGFGCRLSVSVDLFRTALLTPRSMGKGLEKVPLTIACLKPPGWLIAISGDPSIAVETIRKKKKKKKKKKTEIIPLRIGAWNVRTLVGSAGSDRPQRRTALVGRELGRYGIQITALSETRFADVGLDTLFSRVDAKVKRREAGDVFAIKTDCLNRVLQK